MAFEKHQRIKTESKKQSSSQCQPLNLPLAQVLLHRPWLRVDFKQPMMTLGWSLNKPGFQRLQRVVWREVRNADLPVGLDVYEWLDTVLVEAAYEDAAALLTSANITIYQHAVKTVEGISAEAIATVGLSNAERVGSRQPLSRRSLGTINVLVAISTPLEQPALLEALSIAVEARTAAVMDGGPLLPQGRATGTGTDCLLVAAPQEGTEAARYAGLHTAIGEAVGGAVYQAVIAGVRLWKPVL